MTTLEGKTVIVSGGSRGIGAEIVRTLVAAKADVAFTYQTNDAAATALVDELAGAGAKVLAFRCDSRDLKTVRSTVDEIAGSLGPIAGLVNNAGITRDRPLVMMSQEEWQEVIDTNLTGVFNFCRAVIFSMIKRKEGKIVNIGSVSGQIGNRSQTNYSAAKAGVIGFTKALAKETAQYGITVNVVAPGYIDTDMLRNLHEQTLKQVVEHIPAKRLGTAQEVARLVGYLLSADASYITGQVLTMAGGLAI
jgi:3-oxoacyl-[acyl-carrier protein] reductase